ncbi:MAG: hypothetical protein K8M05_31420 [Deltaproteobacteria bacterium]|nr:hypothetical protein [Kofleriaceae bacterium]
MRTSLLHVLVVVPGAALVACSDPAPEPAAAVLSAAPDTLYLGDDTRNDLTIVVAYADGDGDLGRGTARVHDCRAADVVTAIALPSIATDEAVAEGVAITGELELRVNDVGDVTLATSAPPACAELGAPAPAAGEAVFCVVLVDRAGNVGPGDCTSPLALSQL